jgi:predicted dehydrogenase
MSPPARIGFLGVGWIGRARLEALVKSGTVRVEAIYDPSAAMLAPAQAVAPSAIVAHSESELLDRELDGVVIATPSALHAEQAVSALQHGCAVFCQKPLGRTARETQRVIDAARSADRLLGVDLSYRFTRAMRAIRRLIVDGGIGQVYAADLVFHNAYGPDKAWFYDRALSGGGCVIDLGTHLVDLALWCLCFPEVERVSSRLYAAGRPIGSRANGGPVEDFAEAHLVLETGTVVRIACSWKVSMGCNAVIHAAFHGTRGGVALRNLNGSFYDFMAEAYDGTRRRILAEPPDDWGGRAVVDWATRLSHGTRFDPEVERVRTLASVLDGIYRAGTAERVLPAGQRQA